MAGIIYEGTCVGCQHQPFSKRILDEDFEFTYLILRPEPDNPYDSNAVAVHVFNAEWDLYKVGYIPEADINEAHAFIDYIKELGLHREDLENFYKHGAYLEILQAKNTFSEGLKWFRFELTIYES